MKVSFKTLGCRLNQHETDSLVSGFDKAGFSIVPFKTESDITVINTCTVTSQSDHKSRNIIKQAVKANPNSKIVVTGCMAEQYKAEIEKIPGVSLVITNKNKSNIVALVQAKLSNKSITTKENNFNYQPLKKSMHTRAAIKIQDGCDNFCTFCIIPSVRGRAVSRPVNDIIENVKQTINNGFKEIVITGVNIGRYDFEGLKFVDLLEIILNIPGDFRVRISSLEPDGFGNELIRLFKHPKLMPHLHLCLQSGSDQVLLKMRRMYNVASFVKLAKEIKASYPDFNLTTDIIVGFPGESETNFNETLKVVSNIQFSHVHTFKYSVRTVTYAERMPMHVDEQTKNERSLQLRELTEKNKEVYYRSFIGKTQTVLVEKHLGDNWYRGYGENYIPILFKHHENLNNQFVNIEITDISKNESLKLRGYLLNHSILNQTATKEENKVIL